MTRMVFAPSLVAVAHLVVNLWSPLAHAQVAPDGGNTAYEWDHTFPIWGKKLAQKGIRFPKPWGIGANYAYANQLVNITDMEIAVSDSDYVNLDDVIVFDEVRSQVHVTNLRMDLWVFPFVNVYALGNYVIESQTDTSISEPFAFTAGAKQPGGGGGFGTTLAFGFAGFFGTLDMNWTWNKMEKLADPVSTFLLTPRVGKNFGRIGPISLAVWVGAMRQKIGAKTEGTIRLREAIPEPSEDFVDQAQDWYESLGPAEQLVFQRIVDNLQGADPEIHYRMNKHLASKWNMVIGADVGLTENLFFRAEVGFIERTQVILGLNYRFDGLPSKSPPSPSEPPRSPAASAAPP